VNLDRPLEEVISERAFAEVLSAHAASFCRLSNALLERPGKEWTKRHFYQLATESDALESFLDDFGAKFNRTYSVLRELVASSRWLAMAGFSLSHLESRFESYGLASNLSADEAQGALASFQSSRSYLSASIAGLLTRSRADLEAAGIHWASDKLPDHSFAIAATKRRLPRNMGQEDLVDESQRIAEIASKYLTACELLEGLGIKRLEDPGERRRRLSSICKEEQARVYEATVHNLQSTYDTYIKNTVVESRDERLPLLRGHLSGALHLLECVTFLTHFVERHELGARGEKAEHVIADLVDRTRIEAIILNHLLFWANALMQRGRSMAEELLPSYINLQELQVDLPENLRLHARPAALIVNIVGRYGTPVEMEVDGHRCNAGSILELLVTVGSHPDARRYVFRGDVHPLRDIGLLFESGLGEDGIDNLPNGLHYLRSS
jgi:hypothetical protein